MKRQNLEISTPENEGVPSELIINYLNALEKSNIELHGIIITKSNKKIFEAYNEPYKKNISHIMHSFTKCFTNMAVGIAYTQNLLKLEDKVLKYFPEYEKNANDNLKELTIRDLITMRSGQIRSIGGNEWRPLKSSWIKAYFDVPFTEKPGSKYMYSSGNSYILSAIVQKVTNKTCHKLIEEYVSNKIGLNKFEWLESPEGICSGGNGISLTVEDMVRIGLLYINNGFWNGEEILKKEWIDLSLGKKNPQFLNQGEPEYNFHWEHIEDTWSSNGMFSQRCIIVPQFDLVVAMTAADKFCDECKEVKLFQKEVVTPLKNKIFKYENMCKILNKKRLQMSLESKNISVEDHIELEDKIYKFKPVETIDNIDEIVIEKKGNRILFGIHDHRGIHFVENGIDSWLHGNTSITGAYLHHQYEKNNNKISACAYWSERNILSFEWKYPEMAFTDYVNIFWGENYILFKRSVNMNSQDEERPEIRAILIKEF